MIHKQSIPLPPQLPPSCISVQASSLINVNRSKTFSETYRDTELDLAVDRLLGQETNTKLFSVYNHVVPQLQQGPKCGLVALNMALSQNPEGVEAMYANAVSRNMTQHGEMFSAAQMAKLASESCTRDIIHIENGLDKHLRCILKTISNGGYVLVPYDADRNHSPGCFNGHRAHWALVCGFLICRTPDINTDQTENYTTCDCHTKSTSSICNSLRRADQRAKNSLYQINNSQSSLQITSDDILLSELTDINDVEDKIAVYLICRQGKSLHLGLWNFVDIVKSNCNLKEIDPKRSGGDYIVPVGGVEQGLCGQAVLIL